MNLLRTKSLVWALFSNLRVKLLQIFKRFWKIISPFATSRNMILHLVIRNEFLPMTKVKILLRLKSLRIFHLLIQLHVSKFHILPHLKLLWEYFLRSLIFLRNILFKMLSSWILFHQGSNQQEPHLETVQILVLSIQSTNLPTTQWLKLITYFYIPHLLSLEITEKKITHLLIHRLIQRKS